MFSGEGSDPRLTSCTFSGSSARGKLTTYGGGVSSFRSVTTLVNCTLSVNSADFGGGMASHQSSPKLSSCTVTGNSAQFGGGMYGDMSSAELRSTIVANSTTGGDCDGSLPTSQGYNLDSDGTCALGGMGDVSGADPLLGALQDNGGATLTHALLPGSPALDGGNRAGCTDPGGLPLTTDQRGWLRHVDGDRDGAAFCDIGAYEALLSLYMPMVLRSAPSSTVQ